MLTEAMFLLSHHAAAQDEISRLLENGALQIDFHLAEHLAEVRALRHKYSVRPMSLADACIVRMAEIHDDHAVFTLDTDFTIYRKHGREPVPLVAPGD